MSVGVAAVFLHFENKKTELVSSVTLLSIESRKPEESIPNNKGMQMLTHKRPNVISVTLMRQGSDVRNQLPVGGGPG